MPTPQDPSTVAQRWAQNLGRATQKITAGVQAVTTSPTAKAAAAVGKWQAAIADPATAQRFQQRLQSVSLADWQGDMINKGIPRIASGAANAQDKFTQFLSQFLPFVDSVASRVRQMPSTTLEDRINRAVAQMRGTSAFKRTM